MTLQILTAIPRYYGPSHVVLYHRKSNGIYGDKGYCDEVRILDQLVNSVSLIGSCEPTVITRLKAPD
jgi:hypothetical protein